MVIVIAAILTATAFVVLIRVLWSSAKPGPYATLITLATVVLVLGLALLAATGRLHWLAAAAAAVFPFLRRGLGLVRYLPWLGSLVGGMRGHAGGGRAGNQQPSRGGALNRSEALQVLGLETSQPSREEILAAHRRLIQKLHPDRGGSKYLAQQLNEAKQRLLDDL